MILRKVNVVRLCTFSIIVCCSLIKQSLCEFIINTPAETTTPSSESTLQIAPGEILVEDSVLYSQAPGTRQLRRALWPMMEDSMTELAKKVTKGAQMMRQFIATNAMKLRAQLQQQKKKIRVFVAPARVEKPRPRPPVMPHKKPKSPPKEEHYHSYGSDPSEFIKSKEHSMNALVKANNYIENQLIKDIELSSEQKVEATMGSFFKKPANVEEELINGLPHNFHNGWKPVKSESPGKGEQKKPKPVSKLHTNVMNLPIAKQVEYQFHDGLNEENVGSISDHSVENIHEASVQRPITTPYSTRTRNPPEQGGDGLRNHKNFTGDFVPTTTKHSNDKDKTKSWKQSYRGREHVQSLTTERSFTSFDGSETKVTRATARPPFVTTDRSRTKNRLKPTKPSSEGGSQPPSRGTIKFGDKLQYT